METKNINQPTIADFIIRKDEVDVCFTTVDGQQEIKLHLTDGEDEMLTVNYGDVSGIGFGGTDNWGKDCLPLYLDYTSGATNYDGVMVDDITIQSKSEWCTCERLANGALKYTAVSTNPSSEPRTTYFVHSTTDTTVKRGYNAGRPASKSWYVTVIQEGNPDAKPEPEPQPQPKDLGKHQFDVGVISDLHICANNDKNSQDTSDDWWDEDDFRAAMSIFVADTDIKFIASCGDIAESQTNDYKKHPEATCDKDYAEFKEMYDVPYWQVAGLRFFSPMGNHDFYGIFESRSGDTITGKKNSECISGYNASVNTRIANLWPTGQQINGIVPGRGRIVFDLENGKSTASGQADMRFFSFNDYVDLYARKGGYTGSSIWDAKKGGISDEAIKCAKKFVNSNWNSVKDNLVMWNDGGGHGRNGYSKLNYWTTKDDNIFIYLSVDYGNDVWGVKDGWHDRMIHARTLINLNEDDPYVKRMKEFVADTGYSSADAKYDYQYYSPNTLIWLKEILENNTDKKIFIFSHHYLPNKVGNSTGIPKNGDWSYAVISKAGDLTSEGINKGSNCLTGVEFWFLNKLNNLYKNVVWFSGHSHISYECPGHIDCHDYAIVRPDENEQYAYTKASNIPTGDAAYSVALPSLSKPRYVNGSQTKRLYDDAEITIMKIYENGVELNGYKIKKNNKDVYDKNNPLFNQQIVLK